MTSKSGFAPINGAKIYYETAGEGQPFVMIHAGIADSRQWNGEFDRFKNDYTVIRYDLRGYGKSDPVAGDFNHLDDLVALLDHLKVDQPIVLMGCSMGGELAMDFTLAHRDRVKALIMVGSEPSGFDIDLPPILKFKDAGEAFDAGNFALASEIETQIFFDGEGRTPDQVNQAMRKLTVEMNLIALTNESKELGNQVPNTDVPAVDHLAELMLPVLVVIGEYDVAYMQATADLMMKGLPNATRLDIADAGHLPNMEHPEEFQQGVTVFLRS